MGMDFTPLVRLGVFGFGVAVAWPVVAVLGLLFGFTWWMAVAPVFVGVVLAAMVRA